MTSPQQPLDALVAWYARQPLEVRQDLAVQFLIMVGADYSPTPDVALRNRLDEIDRASEIRVAGATVQAAAMIDFVLFQRSSRADWDEAEARNRWLQAKLREEGNDELAANVDAMAERMPLRGRMWMRAAEDWRELREGVLSLPSMNEWLRDALAASINRRS